MPRKLSYIELVVTCIFFFLILFKASLINNLLDVESISVCTMNVVRHNRGKWLGRPVDIKEALTNRLRFLLEGP